MADRFVITIQTSLTGNKEVSVVDTEQDYAFLFNVDCENEEDAKIIAKELDGLVRELNEKDQFLKRL